MRRRAKRISRGKQIIVYLHAEALPQCIYIYVSCAYTRNRVTNLQKHEEDYHLHPAADHHPGRNRAGTQMLWHLTCRRDQHLYRIWRWRTESPLSHFRESGHAEPAHRRCRTHENNVQSTQKHEVERKGDWQNAGGQAHEVHNTLIITRITNIKISFLETFSLIRIIFVLIFIMLQIVLGNFSFERKK